ncbi:MAG TPA: hypothetical protein VM578_08230 [Candidatus Saccharimonadales bacterium]|nr:hypothetical protein [Candidatus Saccharimonadales bacterium]
MDEAKTFERSAEKASAFLVLCRGLRVRCGVCELAGVVADVGWPRCDDFIEALESAGEEGAGCFFEARFVTSHGGEAVPLILVLIRETGLLNQLA